MIRIEPLQYSAEVWALEQLAHPFPWPEATLKSCFASGYQQWGAYDNDGRLLGYALVHQVLEQWTLVNLATAPHARRRGVATALMQALLAAAGRLPHCEVWLEVRCSNHAAIALYQRLAFTRVGIRKDYYPSAEGREDGWVMLLKLPILADKTYLSATE